MSASREGRSWKAQWIACLRFEAARRTRRTLWFLLATALGVLLVGWIESRADEPAEGFALFSAVVATSLPLLSFLLLIVGCTAVNQDVASGAMRAVLLRPVSREMVLGARLAWFAGMTCIASILVCVVAWCWTLSQGGFGDVLLDLSAQGLDPVVKVTESEMRGLCVRLAVVALPAVVCAPLCGVFLSTLMDSPGVSVAVGALTYLSLQTVGALGGVIGAASFPWLVGQATDRMIQLAAGIETHRAQVEGLGVTSAEGWAPTIMAAAFGVASLIAFRERTLSC